MPNAVRFEALSIRRQLNYSRLDRSFEEQFDLSCRICAVQREPRVRNSLRKRRFERNEYRGPEPGTVANREHSAISATRRITVFHRALDMCERLPGLSHESAASRGQNNFSGLALKQDVP